LASKLRTFRQPTFKLINVTRKLRYQVCFFTVYSLGLRSSEGLQLQIDATRGRVHMRGGKGDKDRSVTLPEKALEGSASVLEHPSSFAVAVSEPERRGATHASGDHPHEPGRRASRNQRLRDSLSQQRPFVASQLRHPSA
jgi:integrase